MVKSRIAIGLIALVAPITINAPAMAQRATPTPTPASTATPSCTPRNTPIQCAGATKLQVTWLSRDPSNLRVFVSATGCPTVPSCGSDVAGKLVSVPPVNVTIADKDGNSLMSTTVTDPGHNIHGCPGGIDSYRGIDRLRLVYGAATTLIAQLRVPQNQQTPPTLPTPMVVTVRDACGSLVDTSVSTCFTKASSTVTTIKCF